MPLLGSALAGTSIRFMPVELSGMEPLMGYMYSVDTGTGPSVCASLAVANASGVLPALPEVPGLNVSYPYEVRANLTLSVYTESECAPGSAPAASAQLAAQAAYPRLIVRPRSHAMPCHAVTRS